MAHGRLPFLWHQSLLVLLAVAVVVMMVGTTLIVSSIGVVVNAIA